MKKIFAITLAIVSALFLFSCKGAIGPAGPEGTDPATGWMVAKYQEGVNSFTGTFDTRIWDAYPTSNYGGIGDNYIGVEGGKKKRLVIEFYPNGLPTGVVVQAATLSMKALATFGAAPSLTLYEMGSSWFEMETTWNNAKTSVAWTTPGGDFTNTAVSNSVTVSQSGKWYTWTLKKELIQEKIDAGTTYGFIMKGDVETGDSEADLILSEYATVADRPILTIYYTLP
jgi:hypothetical protein